MATMVMATATKRVMATAMMWQATKRAMVRAMTMTKRAVATASKRAKATD